MIGFLKNTLNTGAKHSSHFLGYVFSLHGKVERCWSLEAEEADEGMMAGVLEKLQLFSQA